MVMDKLLIGIDPDVNKSGYAVWSPENKSFLGLWDYSLFDIFVKLQYMRDVYDIFVYLEDGRLAKGVWHKHGAKNVGKNMAIAQQIHTFMDAHHIPYLLLRPAGYSKYDHKTFCNITGWPIKERTNSEKRAAAMMVFGRTK